MKRVVAFTIADSNNMRFYAGLSNSLRKFHTDQEIPLILIDEPRIASYRDNKFFYRATPILARELVNEYETIIKLDVDQIICAPLNHIWENTDYDIACVSNFSPKEPPYQVWDIPPQDYLNCGMVAMRSKEFIEHWYSLCQSGYFDHYQMREQDLMNILYYYGNYRTRFLDWEVGFHGMASKGYWQYIKLNEKNELILPADSENGYPKTDTKVVSIHYAGGNDPSKGNYRILFQSDVIKRIEYLIHD